MWRILCRIADSLWLFDLLLALEQYLGWRRHAVVLMYHSVRGPEQNKPCLSEMEAGVPADQFRRQVELLSKWYRAASACEIAQAVTARRPFSQDVLLLTFDDGYADNLYVAAPILEAKNLRGLVFLATQAIDRVGTYWWIRLSDICHRLERGHLSDMMRNRRDWPDILPTLAADSLESNDYRRRFRRQLAAWLEQQTVTDRDALLGSLELRIGRTDATCLPLVTWDEARQLQEFSVEIGGHTATHPHLSRLTAEEIRSELYVSTQRLREELGKSPSAFAYPYGDSPGGAVPALQENGYRCAFTTEANAVDPKMAEPFALPRMSCSRTSAWEIKLLAVAWKFGKYLPSRFRATWYARWR